MLLSLLQTHEHSPVLGVGGSVTFHLVIPQPEEWTVLRLAVIRLLGHDGMTSTLVPFPVRDITCCTSPAPCRQADAQSVYTGVHRGPQY